MKELDLPLNPPPKGDTGPDRILVLNINLYGAMIAKVIWGGIEVMRKGVLKLKFS